MSIHLPCLQTAQRWFLVRQMGKYAPGAIALEMRTYKKCGRLTHTRNPYTLVAFAPDGGSIASAGLETDPSVTVRENTRTSDRTDSVVKFWDVNTQRQLGTIETDTRPGFSYQVRSIDYSPSGKQLAVGILGQYREVIRHRDPFS